MQLQPPQTGGGLGHRGGGAAGSRLTDVSPRARTVGARCQRAPTGAAPRPVAPTPDPAPAGAAGTTEANPPHSEAPARCPIGGHRPLTPRPRLPWPTPAAP